MSELCQGLVFCVAPIFCVKICVGQVENLSIVRIYIPKDLRPIEARERCLKTVLEVLRRFPEGPQLLDSEDDMKVSTFSAECHVFSMS